MANRLCLPLEPIGPLLLDMYLRVWLLLDYTECASDKVRFNYVDEGTYTAR